MICLSNNMVYITQMQVKCTTVLINVITQAIDICIIAKSTKQTVYTKNLQ